MKQLFLILPLLGIIFLSSCVKDKEDTEVYTYTRDGYELIKATLDIPSSPYDYTLRFPAYYNRQPQIVDPDMATLGRVIFYDKKLSKDQKVSCGSCHSQSLGFADNKAKSDGIEDRATDRNSIALGSVFSFLEYYGSPTQGRIPFFWDNRATSAQDQARQTFANEKEMGMEMHQVAERINEQAYYKPIIRAAYQKDEITGQEALDALAVFIDGIGSFRSKFDKSLDKLNRNNGVFNNIQADFVDFTSDENKGKAIYLASCGTCHGSTLGPPAQIHANNGLHATTVDQGVGKITGLSYEMGNFKIPTLRNIEVSGPYMHDGSIATIDEVIEHYSSGIKNHPNLSSELRGSGNTPKQFNFSADEKRQLKAFLFTLTDHDLMTDPKFGDPFIK